MAKQKIPSVYFTSLAIENVRCFGERQTLDLTVDGRPARWTLILGDNGVGKTTLLQCLAWMQPVRENVNPDDPKESEDKIGLAITDQQNEMFESLVRMNCREATLNATVSLRGRLWSVGGGKPKPQLTTNTGMGIRLTFDEKGRLDTWKPTEDRSYINELDINFEKPPIITYGANRHLEKRNLDKSELADGSASARLYDHTELYDLEQMLDFLDHASKSTRRREQGMYNRVKESLIKILPGDFTLADLKVDPLDRLDTGAPSGVRLRDASGNFIPLSSHSLGYQMTLAWTADLAWRLWVQYPDSPNPLAEPAVVLIDEIELHLHPLWQLEIVDRLSSIFTGTQFVATSHSPLMAQVAETANIVRVRWQENYVEIISDPEWLDRRWRVDQILMSELFDVPRGRNKEIGEMYDRRHVLLDKHPRTADEEAELQALRAKLSELPTAPDPKDQQSIDFIRDTAARLKQHGIGEE